MSVTVTLTDDNAPCAFTATGATSGEAFRALYDELVRRNIGDCSAHIRNGYVTAPWTSHPYDISLDDEPETFWRALVEIMLADTQDYDQTDA